MDFSERESDKKNVFFYWDKDPIDLEKTLVGEFRNLFYTHLGKYSVHFINSENVS